MATNPLQIKFDIVETDRQIQTLMFQEIAKQLNQRIPKRLNNIDNRLKESTFDFLQTTSTYTSLISGQLAAHFGLPRYDRKIRIDDILSALVNRMEVRYTPIRVRGRKFINGLTFSIVTTNLSEVLTLPEGKILTQKGQVLDWMSWLLTMGDRIIISEYEINLESGKGRSGGGIMIAASGGSWRVPPEFSGTQNDNWFTRSLRSNSYFSIIENIIKHELRGI